ncbi:MAG: Fe-S protein assembly co-chaperone HscB [Pseudomonadota bacterium]
MNLNTDYFSLFGLPVAFALDANGLQPTWRTLQQQLHPDRAAADDAAAQRHALQMTSHLNAAYDTLRDPVRRARYLLALAGHGADSERVSVMDTDFLMAQMELRESLEEAVALHELDAIEAEAQDWLDSLLREFPLDYAAEDWPEATDCLRKMQFMTRLLAEIREQRERLEDELDDF